MNASELHLEMSRTEGCTVVAVSGSLHTVEQADTFAGALAALPLDDQVIVDITALTRFGLRCAHDLCDRLEERGHRSEAVVVSDRPEITLQLVLSDVDRIAPIVPSLAAAMQVLRARSGFVAADVA
jgi:anti-anti-sigma regulatory factor